MLGYRRVCLFAVSAGSRLIGRSCPFSRSVQRSVRCSGSLDIQDASLEVTTENTVQGRKTKAYTAKQRDRILHLLNTASESQLDCVKELQGKRAVSIVQYREQCGPFRDMNTLCEVEHFNPAFMHKVFDSMLSLSDKSDRKNDVKFLKPDVPMPRLQESESIISIAFGLRKLAWVHINSNMTVQDWRQRECFHFEKGKHLPEIYLEDVSSVVSSLPQADFYILEKPSVSSQNASLFPVVLHLRTVEAMLYCLLNPPLTEQREHRVFTMDRNTVGKHFGIMVGEARTSGVDIVQRLIDEAILTTKPRVNVPSELVQQYRQQFQARGQNRNEHMCDALLQAVAFYELVSI